jgi:hypothetical protein
MDVKILDRGGRKCAKKLVLVKQMDLSAQRISLGEIDGICFLDWLGVCRNEGVVGIFLMELVK